MTESMFLDVRYNHSTNSHVLNVFSKRFNNRSDLTSARCEPSNQTLQSTILIHYVLLKVTAFREL